MLKKIIKSKSDKRIYSYNRLPNKLKYLLVHDSSADKSSAAMNVNVGSLLDPKDFPGLAHFLEHMLFMGTKKFPQENDFSEFLNKNAGFSNAYTDLDSTNYFFEVNNENFSPALDRFSQFFTSPLFNESAVSREVQAVDSEHKKNIQSDMWRFVQLMRSEANEKSLFNRFATGNLETLNKPLVRDALLDFHRKYYSSHLMSLVLVSNRGIDELHENVEHFFSQVPQNKDMDKYLKYSEENISDNDFEDTKKGKNFHFNFLDPTKISEIPAYDKSECGNLYHLIPVKDKDQIFIYYFFNENYNLSYKKKPMEYIASVLGHEGPNSLSSSLIKDDLITSLSAGGYTQANSLTTFYFNISLTKKGLKKSEEILERVFEAVNMLKKNPINKRYFEELNNISQIKFDYKGKEDPSEYSSDLASKFTTKPVEDILIGDYIAEEYDEEFIKETINKFTIENSNIYLSSRSFEEKVNLSEKWYGTKFSKIKYPKKIIDLINGNVEKSHKHFISYPPENKFIARKFDIKDLEKKGESLNFPELIDKNEKREIWFKQDNIFLLPKAIIYLQIYLKKDILPQTEYNIIASIMNNLFENELQEVSYMAQEASMSINFFFNSEGMIISIEGYDSALKSSAIEIITKFKATVNDLNNKLKNYYQERNHIMKNSTSTNSDFLNLLEKINSKIENSEMTTNNFFLSDPYRQTLSNLDIFLRNNSTDHLTKLKSIKNLKKTISEKNLHLFSLFLDSFLTESKYEWLIQGNLTKKETLDIVNSTENILQENILPKENISPIKIANISENKNFYVNFLSQDENNLNSSLTSYFQVGNLWDKDYCKLLILEALFREKFFDDLRTKKALGYIVRLGLKEDRDINGVFCLVQSSQRSPEYLHNEINEFLAKPEFEEIDEDLYKEYVNSVIDEISKKDLKLEEEVLRNFHEIKSRNYKFDKKTTYVNLLKEITLEEVKEFYYKIFAENVKRLDIGLLAHCHKEENLAFEIENNKKMELKGIKRIKVESANEFKSIITHYPDYYNETVKDYVKI